MGTGCPWAPCGAGSRTGPGETSGPDAGGAVAMGDARPLSRPRASCGPPQEGAGTSRAPRYKALFLRGDLGDSCRNPSGFWHRAVMDTPPPLSIWPARPHQAPLVVVTQTSGPELWQALPGPGRRQRQVPECHLPGVLPTSPGDSSSASSVLGAHHLRRGGSSCPVPGSAGRRRHQLPQRATAGGSSSVVWGRARPTRVSTAGDGGVNSEEGASAPRVLPNRVMTPPSGDGHCGADLAGGGAVDGGAGAGS